MRTMFLGSALIAALVAAVPASAAPIEVTRFHLSQPLAGMTIAVVPPDGIDANNLQYQAWLSGISAELARAGFKPVAAGQPADLTATPRIDTQTSTQQRSSPFSVGIGGATGGRNVGIGGGFSFPIGKGSTRTLVLAMLNLQIKRNSDAAVQWEGRASETVKPADVTASINRLARAMLTGFPGVSGKTVKVKPAP
jgi:hypothetical protein